MTTSTLAVPIDSHLHPVPSWALADHPMPTGREEVWRFTPMRVVTPLLTDAPAAGSLTRSDSLPDGVTARVISVDEARALSGDAPVDRTSSLAVENVTQALLIEVPAELELITPVEVSFTGVGAQRSYDWVVFQIGHHAKASIVVKYEGSAEHLVKTDVLVGDAADVNFVSVHDWADDTLHAGQISYVVGRDAQLRTVSATMGGKLVRLVERATYAGPGGQLEQFGLYFVNGEHHVEHRIFVDHNEPKTVSHCDYRGALQGKGAHSVWVGDVLIRKAAEGITTYESNKNLVLTEGCRADSVPNLEIETGEIEGAGHSASTGRFDDDQLFYLRSRGIPEDEAKRLVVQGFFLDIIRKIGVNELEERLMAAVDAELEIMTQHSEGN